MRWPTGGKRLTRTQREEIIRIFIEVSQEQATALAVSLGLSPLYAYKLVRERGLTPRNGKSWNKQELSCIDE